MSVWATTPRGTATTATRPARALPERRSCVVLTPTGHEPDQCPCGAPWGAYAPGLGYACSLGFKCPEPPWGRPLRPSWEDWACGVAEAVAARGDCRRTRVGAALFRPDWTVASVGFNGVEPGGFGCIAGGCPRGLLTHDQLPRFEDGGAAADFNNGIGKCVALHAEINCCANARENTKGYIMAITRQPCDQCIKSMKAHRLEKAIWRGGSILLR